MYKKVYNLDVRLREEIPLKLRKINKSSYLKGEIKMTKEELEIIEKKVERAKELKKIIKFTQEKIDIIRYEIGTLVNTEEFLAKIKSYERVLYYEEVLGAFPSDEEIREFGEYVIEFLQKKIDKAKVEFENL